MTFQLSRGQARRLLARYHLTPTDVAGVFARLGTVQYDPLNPVGRNPDLVLQARVPGYRVDDWQPYAYTKREIYDGWDKQACLIPASDWPNRELIRERYRPYHDAEILQTEIAATAAILAALDERGPLSSLEFEQSGSTDGNTWYGATQARRILRSLWACGEVVTHHRIYGRHYYDRPAKVIPAPYFNQPPLRDPQAYYRWIVARRFQATGLLRATAEAAIWSACGTAAQRKQALAELVEAGVLTPVLLENDKTPYYAWTPILDLLDQPPLEPRLTFLGPLDSLLWDRKGVQQIFGFDYIWEVYKPQSLRKWGYYVLPVFWGERFVARIDSSLKNGIWTVTNWWWESDVQPDALLLDALRLACQRFLLYLGAQGARVDEQVDAQVRQIIQSI
jgi:uncharacterized protein YcaQ